MIEINLQAIRSRIPVNCEPVTDAKIMAKLCEFVDKEKLFGNINIKVECGKLKYMTITQGFTVDELVKTLNL